MLSAQLEYQQPVISIFKESDLSEEGEQFCSLGPVGFTFDKVIREGLWEVVAFAPNLNDNKQPSWEELRAEGPSKAKAQQEDPV